MIQQPHEGLSTLNSPQTLSCSLRLSDFKSSLNLRFSSFQMFQRLRPSPAGLGGQQLPRWGVFRSEPPGSAFLICQFFLTACLVLQTKDKMCDITDTTHLYPVTTPAVAKTTARTGGVTSGRALHSTSHPPTSLPTEGTVKRCIQVSEQPFPWSTHRKWNDFHMWSRPSTALVFLFHKSADFPQIQSVQVKVAEATSVWLECFSLGGWM